MNFDQTVIPVLVSAVSTFYTPIALGLYTLHKRHPSIRYRQPGIMFTVGGCLSTCSILFFIILIVNARCIFVFFWLSFLLCALVTYLMLQISLVITFQITEMLANPSDLTPAKVLQLRRYRWGFYPLVYNSTWVILNTIFVVPIYYPFDSYVLLHESLGYCYNTFTWSITLASFGLLGVLQAFFAYQVSRIVDNFGLRDSILATAKGNVLIAVVSVVLALFANVFDWNWYDIYRIKQCTACFPIHVLFYYHFIRPLRLVLYPRAFNQIVIDVSSVQYERRGTIAIEYFQSFLEYPDGNRAFLDFCHLNLCLEPLLAWNLMKEYQLTPTYTTAMQV